MVRVEVRPATGRTRVRATPPRRRRYTSGMNRVSTLAIALNAAADQVPEWVQLVPAGAFAGRDGRTFRLADAQAVIEATRALAMDLPIDINHATDLAAPLGGESPAAGWIVELQARDDGIWGRVDWNERGRAAVGGREYRYLSPAFRHDATGAVRQILRAGLTNDPNLHLQALNARTTHRETDMIDVNKLLAALGLADTADEAVALNAIERLKTGAAALAAVMVGLGVKPDADTAEIMTALNSRQGAGAPDLSRYVPIETMTALQSQVASLQQRLNAADAADIVGGAIKAGKLLPAQRDWALALHASNPDALKSYLDNAPVIVGGQVLPAAPPAGGDQLTETEKAICAQLGITHDVYIASRKAEAA